MNTDEVLDVFREAGALLEGHFILSSGRRSSIFLQKALIFKNPRLTEIVCKALAEKVSAQGIKPDVIIAPVPGYFRVTKPLGIWASTRFLSNVLMVCSRFAVALQLSPGAKC